ncbi:hypothetical protein CL635_00860 [bacterium]|nr:hypothetical protein [bacterium]
MDLTLKQQRFINEYLRNSGNGTAAARVAGYNGSDDYLAVQASRLIRNDKVKDALEGATEDISALRERLVGEVRHMALTKTTEPLSNNQKLKALDMLSKISGLYEDETRPRMQINLQQINVKEASEPELLEMLKKLKQAKEVSHESLFDGSE